MKARVTNAAPRYTPALSGEVVDPPRTRSTGNATATTTRDADRRADHEHGRPASVTTFSDTCPPAPAADRRRMTLRARVPGARGSTGGGDPAGPPVGSGHAKAEPDGDGPVPLLDFDGALASRRGRPRRTPKRVVCPVRLRPELVPGVQVAKNSRPSTRRPSIDLEDDAAVDVQLIAAPFGALWCRPITRPSAVATTSCSAALKRAAGSRHRTGQTDEDGVAADVVARGRASGRVPGGVLVEDLGQRRHVGRVEGLVSRRTTATFSSARLIGASFLIVADAVCTLPCRHASKGPGRDSGVSPCGTRVSRPDRSRGVPGLTRIRVRPDLSVRNGHGCPAASARS